MSVLERAVDGAEWAAMEQAIKKVTKAASPVAAIAATAAIATRGWRGRTRIERTTTSAQENMPRMPTKVAMLQATIAISLPKAVRARTKVAHVASIASSSAAQQVAKKIAERLAQFARIFMNSYWNL